MVMNIDDPKLTAYALGELDDAGERAQVEAYVASDEAARCFVEETRQTVAMLTQGLATAQTPSLTVAQKQAIEKASCGAKALEYATPLRPRRKIWARMALATAACAAMATA